MALKSWSAKSGKITLNVEPTKARGTAVAGVVVAIPLKTNPWVLEAIHCCQYPLSTKNLDESILAYIVYKNACKKLMGASKSAIQSGASSVKWGSNGDEFQICVTVGPRISAVRKAAGLIVSQFKFGSLYSKYASKCKEIGVKADKSAFEAAASAANGAINSGVTIVGTGRLNVARKDLVEHAAHVINGKLKTSESSKGSARTVEQKEKPEDYYYSIDAPGLEGVAVKGYVDSNTADITKLFGGKLWVPNHIKVDKIANPARIKGYAKSLSSLKGEMTGALVHIAAIGGHVATKYLDSGKQLSESSIVSAISKALK